MVRWIALSVGVPGLIAAATLGATAQTVPAPPAPATPTPTPTPITGPAYGANDPCTSIAAIVSRPSQTTSVCTVRPGRVLIETGYQNTAGTTSTTVQYPQALVRIGTSVPALEVDLSPPMYERIRAAGTTSAGTTDIGAGLKYVFGYSPRFNYGASVFLTSPTGTPGFSAGTGTEAYNVNYGYTINAVFSVAGTLGLDSLSVGGRRYSSVVPSLVLTAGLPNTTGVFFEGAEFTNGAGPATPARLQLLGGVTRGLGPRSQVDVEVGGSPTNATGSYHFIGFGASYYL